MVLAEDSPAEAAKTLKSMFSPEQLEQIHAELELEVLQEDEGNDQSAGK